MATPTIADYLKYANLQLAAEALIRDPDTNILADSGQALIDALKIGNKHASRFTEAQAKDFADPNSGWKVLDQIPNTSSGFSGTLFQNKKTGELVISFRSTEFIDDAVRDNQATNKMEVKEYGWAFGQIADMEEWYTSLKASGKLPPGAKPVVTGYSLGGHLATAFNQLHPNDAAATYTFNGAGVGDLSGAKTLANVIADFDRMRKNTDGMQIAFSSADAQALYESWRQIPTDGTSAGSWSTLKFALETAKLAPILLSSPTEALLLQKALGNMQLLYNESLRVGQLSDTIAKPVSVSLSKVGAFNIDYQIAMLKAAEYTGAYRTNAILSGFDAYAGRNTRYVLPNFYDIYGANPPSGVSNSQWHTGQATPVFIEDQPLYRGAPLIGVAAYSYLFSDIKLLVDNYSTNDFGDTHSLVLIVDSLAITNALAILDPTLTLDTAATLFKAASAAKQESILGSKGKAEGDVLEWVLDGLVNIFTNKNSSLHDGKATNGDSLTTGNTWADENLRKNFYDQLALLNDENQSAYKSLAGRFTLGLPDASLASGARTDFASLLSLLTLSPVALKAMAGEENAIATELGAKWGGEYAGWLADNALSEAQRKTGLAFFSEHYLQDRAAFLAGISDANTNNTGTGKALWTEVSTSETIYFKDQASGLSLQQQNSNANSNSGPQYLFGGTGNDNLSGADKADHLYGGAGVGIDNLNGGQGDDYLEGGAGNDTLTGGKGNDTLIGGQDLDTYQFANGDGWDTIEDADGKGVIYYDTATLTGGDAVGDSGVVWQKTENNKTYTYILTDWTEGGETFKRLSITGPDGGMAINRWQPGQLGITLPGAQPVIKQPPVFQKGGAQGILFGGDATGNLITGGTTSDVLAGGLGADKLDGGAGQDFLFGDMTVVSAANDWHLHAPTGTHYDLFDWTYVTTDGTQVRDPIDPGWYTSELGIGDDDTLKGGAGDDYLHGGGGNDLLEGGTENDHLYGGLGKDVLLGQDGNDTLAGGRGSDTLLGGIGNDFLYGEDAYANDETYIPRDDGNDQLDGGAGNDTLVGMGGADILEGGTGSDQLYGDDDETPGQFHGNDLLYGGEGNDSLWGYGGADFLDGGENDDMLEGDSFAVQGQYHGNDTLVGGLGNDELFGDGKDDRLDGGAGNDWLSGDAPSSQLDGQYHGNDTLDGGDGADSLIGGGANDQLYGGEGDDVLYGDGADGDALGAAYQGNDYLDGGSSRDVLYGGGGNDTLFGGTGADYMDGGTGDDLYQIGASDAPVASGYLDVIYDSAGADRLKLDVATSALRLTRDGNNLRIYWNSDAQGLIINNGMSGAVETITFSDQQVGWTSLLNKYLKETTVQNASTPNSTLAGGAFADNLSSTGGGSTFYGGTGNDWLNGTGGGNAYVFRAGDGSDTISNYDAGLAGTDTLRFEDLSATDLRLSKASQDLLFRIKASGEVVTIKNYFNAPANEIDRVEFADGNAWDKTQIMGTLNDTANLTINGTGNADRLSGDDGDEWLFGGGGADTIDGGAGNDTLEGGTGNDMLWGGAGNDTYRFGWGSGWDTVSETPGPAEESTLIELAAGVSQSDVTVRYDYSQNILSLSLNGSNDRMDVLNDGRNWDSYIGGIRFADGAFWSATQIKEKTLSGGAGGDWIKGYATNDTLTGGAGDDYLDGGSGSDTYIFSLGDGHDLIGNYDYSEGRFDTLVLNGLNETDIRLENWGGSDLAFVIKTTRESVAINNFFSGNPDYQIDSVQFANNVTWDKAKILAMATAATPQAPLNGTAASDVLIGGGANDSLNGAGGNDRLVGDSGRDTLNGGSGADTMIGGKGDDSYVVDNVGDVVVEIPNDGMDTVNASISYTLGANLEALTLTGTSNISAFGNALDNSITGNLGNNILDGGKGNDGLWGGAGDDTYRFGIGSGIDWISDDDGYDTLELGNGIETQHVRLTQRYSTLTIRFDGTGDELDINGYLDRFPIEQIKFADGTIWDTATVGTILANASTPNDISDTTNDDGYLLGTPWDDAISSYKGDDTLDGGAGRDSLYGNLNGGNNTYVFSRGYGWDEITDFSKFGTLDLKGINDIDIRVEKWFDRDLAFTIKDTGESITVRNYFVLNTNNSYKIELVKFANGITWSQGDIEQQLAIVPPNLAPNLVTPLPDQTGQAGVVFNYTVARGAFIDPENDQLVFLAALVDGSPLPSWLVFDFSTLTFSGIPDSAGTVSIKLVAEDSLGLSASDVFDIVVAPPPNLTLVGTSGNDTLIGGFGDDALDGGLGNDTLTGGRGNDVYTVDSISDVVTENASEGTDTVRSSVTLTLANNVENLVLTGTAAINAIGNTLNNVLTGNSAANVLSGGTGADTMTGGAGNDTYVVDNVGDIVTEAINEGVDLIQSSVTYTLSANVENLTLTGTTAINGTGNTLDNVLTGNTAANTLTGGAGNDTLSGGAGADAMIGGIGDDTYVVDNAADVVTENTAEGTDLVQSSVSYILATNVENLTLTGTTTISGTGNALDNQLIGNTAANTLTGGAGNDILNGGAGNDTMIGGAGDDTYVVDSATDVVTEALNEGIDLVQSSVTYTLATNVDNLTLTGTTAINGTGNALNNVLTGNSAINTLTGGAGNDTLDGGAGNDTMVGGLGDDTYVVDSASDVVTENASEGTDTVRSSVTLTLANNAENLVLTGTTAINGTGNTLNNVLTGNSAANTLSGGTGADTMIGGAGDDIYVVDNTADVVTENTAEGTDLVQSSVTYTLAANVENLTLSGTTAINGTGNVLDNVLTGNTAINTLTGGAGNDTLNGGTGADTMVGGLGNDTYVVDNTADIVTEALNEGIDLVQSGVTYTVSANVDNLTLTGTTAINGTGNALDNILIGNSANNTLTGGDGNDTIDGGVGNDTMVGGLGDDLYVVNVATDVVTEAASAGNDTIQSAVTLTLTTNVENLVLTGTTAINGTGNTLNNLVRGNTAINTLNGGTGNDILEGGDGNDILTDTSGTALFNGGAGADTITGGASAEIFLGGLGNDTYTTAGGNDVVLFNKGDGQDTFATGGTGGDVISLGGGIAYADLTFSKATNDLVLKIGTTDQITFKDWYAATPSKPVAKLQVMAEAMAGFVQGGSNALMDQKVENFNFAGLAGAFDTARAANTSLTSWALTNALTSFQLAGSDTAALGGDLAYQYGKNGMLAGIGITPALATLSDANLGTNAQTLAPLAGLQTGSVRLS